MIPGSGRSTGEGIGYSLQYSWASLVAELVKNLPVMRDTWVQSLGRENPLEKEMATQYSFLESPMDRGAWLAMGSQESKSQIQLATKPSPPLTPVFWPVEFQLLCSPWGRTELDMTERHFLTHYYCCCYYHHLL